MSYVLKTNKKFDKFLTKHQDLAPKILNALEILANDPYNAKLDIKKLQGYENHYRLRIGKYRILYEIIESQILIFAYDVDSRGGIYRERK